MERMWKESIVVYFEVSFHNLYREAEGKEI
jgi:hypothetical protein